MDKLFHRFENQIAAVSFRNRMKTCEKYSIPVVNTSKPLILDNHLRPANYELELIALNSVLVSKSAHRVLSDDMWMMNCTAILRNNNILGDVTKDSVQKFILDKQVTPQIGYFPLYYRYNYIFNFISDKIDLKTIFLDYFKYDFKWYVYLSLFVTTVFSQFNDVKFDQLYKKMPDVLKQIIKKISKTREDFIKSNKLLYTDKSRNVFLDYNLLMTYPIIESSNLLHSPYIPYIPYACSTSLMYQLTQNDNSLRSRIGKEVLESYILKLLRLSNVTNKYSIHGEETFDRDNKKTSDAILYSEDSIIFIDSKFTSQSLTYRAGDLSAKLEFEMRFADYFEQIIKNIVALKDNRLAHIVPKNDFDYIYGYIITFDTFHISINDDTIKNIIDKYDKKYPAYHIGSVKDKIKIISLIEFENLLMNNSLYLFDYLSGKQPFKKLSTDEIFPDFRSFIHEFNEQLIIDMELLKTLSRH